jgi:hypothetical protein
LPLIRKLHLPALLCALAVLLCELISRPFVSMSICDDGPYILTANTLATTGHIAYNGWAAPMLGWQVVIGALFIKLFGYSFTTVRCSTLLVSLITVFLLQRIFVRAGITERNATLGTLALAVSPLYLLLSITYMSDIFGLFAIVLCLYSCLRALQAATPRATLLWILFAIAANAVFGTARQIAWLGLLVMVPSTLWLLRAQRRILIPGLAATLAGALFIYTAMQWLKHQPYSVPEHILPESFPLAGTLWTLTHFLLEVPLILLPILGLFLVRVRKTSPRVLLILAAILAGYMFLHFYPSHLRGNFLLEPTVDDWIGTRFGFLFNVIQGTPAVFLPTSLRVLLTIVSLGSALILLDSFRHAPSPAPSLAIPWKQLLILLAPFTLAYAALLIPRATGFVLSDRYLLSLLVVAMLCLTRYYQDRMQPQLPLVATVLLIALMALYGVTFSHNIFSLYRARVALAAELRAHGIPDTYVDNGWEYNFGVELQHANHINFPTIVVPANAYVPTPPPPAGLCSMNLYDNTPHIHPLYAASFDPNACYGPAPFDPVHFSRWPFFTPGTLYAVRFTPAQP